MALTFDPEPDLSERDLRMTRELLNELRESRSRYADAYVRRIKELTDALHAEHGKNRVAVSTITQLQQELRAERFKRPQDHAHDPDDPEPVLVLDFNGTMTPYDGFPIEEPEGNPYPNLKKWLDRWVARTSCIHVATAGLWPQVKSDLLVYRARMVQIDAWLKCYGMPVSFILPKIDAAIFYDDRMIPVPVEKVDWDVLGEMAEQEIDKRFALRDGQWVRRPKTRTGREIDDFPAIGEVPPDKPRGYSTPVIDLDVHRTLSLASSSLRVAAPKPGAVEWAGRLYTLGATIHASCAGWNPATHSLEDSNRRLAAMRQWMHENGIPYDEFVTKDHGDLYFDDKGVRHTSWEADGPKLFAMLGLGEYADEYDSYWDQYYEGNAEKEGGEYAEEYGDKGD